MIRRKTIYSLLWRSAVFPDRLDQEVEREHIGAGKHEEYVKLVEDLEREMVQG